MSYVKNPTVVGEAEARLMQIDQLKATALESLKASTVESFKLLWGKPDQTAEMLERMGDTAASGFEAHARTVAYLLASGVQMTPEDYTPPVAYKIHEDGTVTLD